LEETPLLSHLLRIAALAALPALAFAQTVTPPHPFNGTIVSVDGDTVTLQAKDGQNFSVQMAPGWTVSTNRKVDTDAIKPGSFIASTNVPVSATTGRSTEVRILEPGYRPEEGTHAVSQTDSNMMTHGTVKSADKNDAGVELEVTYPGGSRMLLVPLDVPVTLSDPLDKSVLKPGVAVSGVTRTGSDGIARASRLQVTNQERPDATKGKPPARPRRRLLYC
jgi:hypothetical protein